MARSKNSPALFEVIRNAQQKQKEQLERQRQQQASPAEPSPAAALLRSPLYWFKGKHAHDAIHGVPAQPVMREVRPAQPTRSPAPRPFTAEPEHAPPEHAP
ncbi:MAG: hypothetical protein ACTHLZ_16945, partial [Tepidisphaeraceae bacterium]